MIINLILRTFVNDLKMKTSGS